MRRADYSGLGDVVRDGARGFGTKAALIYEGRDEVTWAELDARTNRVANMLAGLGVKAGDRVAMLGKNSIEYLEVLFGAAKLGAVFTPINWRLAPPEVGFILKDSGAAAVVVDAALTRLIEGQLPPGARAVVLGEPESEPDGEPGREDGYAQATARASDADPKAPIAGSDLAMLVYTSGTTGHPKGAMLSHGNFARYCDLDSPDLPAWERILPSDVVLSVMPLFHIGGLEFTLRPLFSRATIVLHREFDTARLLEDMQGLRATFLGLVPTALQMVLHHARAQDADFSSVRRIYYGASPIPLGLLKEAVARVDCEFVQAYGMTETSSTAVMLAPDDHLDPKAPRLRAAGRPVMGAAMKVADAEGRDAVPHEVGEIWLRGPGLMTGYWNRPDATAETITADGWLRTGDAGYLDEDGYVYVHDRVKDMIISGGENVYPTEVESAIYGHPDVAEVAVVGVPDPQWGEAVKAVVTPKPGHEIDKGAVIAWARARIAAYKAPKSVDVMAELPKNAAGKILRREIRAPYWAGHDRQVN